MSKLKAVRFKSLSQIINYYIYNKPGQLKESSFFKSDSRPAPVPVQIFGVVNGKSFECEGSQALWAAITSILNNVLKQYPLEQRKAFEANRLTEWHYQISAEEIAKELQISDRQVYRWLARIRDDLTETFTTRGFLNDNENN